MIALTEARLACMGCTGMEKIYRFAMRLVPTPLIMLARPTANHWRTPSKPAKPKTCVSSWNATQPRPLHSPT